MPDAAAIQDLRQPHGGHTFANVGIAMKEVGMSESPIGETGLE